MSNLWPSSSSSSYLLPALTLVHETLQFVGQVGVFVAQLVVSCAVLLDLSLDLRQHLLELGRDLLPLLLILPAALQSLLLRERTGRMDSAREHFCLNTLM